MRVLWFCNTSAGYESQKANGSHNGGGWMVSAEKTLANISDIELAVCFEMNGQPQKIVQHGVTYYPVPNPNDKSSLIRLKKAMTALLGGNVEEVEQSTWDNHINAYTKVIADFEPDVIHIWGTEKYFGLLNGNINIPVIVHIQGLLNPYFHAFLPPFVSWREYIRSPFHLKKWFANKMSIFTWASGCYREKHILENTKYFFGRTLWDRRVTRILSPNSIYYVCNEMLRDAFYKEYIRQIPKTLTIVTTISRPVYKGFDQILKTAQILKRDLMMDFEWKCFGDIDSSFIEDIIHINHNDVNIKLMGVASSQELINEETNATLYYHSSYIDNSPNSLCEAQILGIPVISANVGGISSLIEDGYTGFLVPANDPYQSASIIKELFDNKELNYQIGNNAKLVARQRHDKSAILNTIIDTYEEIINSHNEHCK